MSRDHVWSVMSRPRDGIYKGIKFVWKICRSHPWRWWLTIRGEGCDIRFHGLDNSSARHRLTRGYLTETFGMTSVLRVQSFGSCLLQHQSATPDSIIRMLRKHKRLQMTGRFFNKMVNPREARFPEHVINFNKVDRFEEALDAYRVWHKHSCDS